MVCTMFCMLGVLLAAPSVAKVPCEQAKPGLSAKVEKAIRDGVYSGGLELAHPLVGKYALLEIVVVPAKIEIAYKENPHATLNLLIAIAEGGRPRDSMLAVSFAFALVDSPAVASVVYRVYKEDTYDAVEVHWEVTPRRHWLGKLKEMMNKAEAKK